MKRILKTLFCIEKLNQHKIISILGLKFKLKDRSLELENIREEIQKLQTYCNYLKTLAECGGDIKKYPQATGSQRTVQRIKVKMLVIVASIFKKHNIEYWLDFGTLIGAYRNNRFIPWDDDIDISTDRETTEKIKVVLNDEFKNTPFCISNVEKTSGFFMRVKLNDMGLIDIFPYDYSDNESSSYTELYENITTAANKYYKKYPINDIRNKLIKVEDTFDGMFKLYEKYNISKSHKRAKWLFRGLDTLTVNRKPSLHLTENLYPLKSIEFENFKFSVPNKIPEFLNECGYRGYYGDLNKFPDYSVSRFHICDDYDDEKLAKYENILDSHLEKLSIKYKIN